ANPAATIFFATYLAAYVAERSTLVGSFPLNAPPPWRDHPPYVSTIIFRPVKPTSPCGPPTIKLPLGLIKYFVSSVNNSLSITSLITSFLISNSNPSLLTHSSCCTDITTVSTCYVLLFLYDIVTCDLPSVT